MDSFGKTTLANNNAPPLQVSQRTEQGFSGSNEPYRSIRPSQFPGKMPSKQAIETKGDRISLTQAFYQAESVDEQTFILNDFFNRCPPSCLAVAHSPKYSGSKLSSLAEKLNLSSRRVDKKTILKPYARLTREIKKYYECEFAKFKASGKPELIHSLPMENHEEMDEAWYCRQFARQTLNEYTALEVVCGGPMVKAEDKMRIHKEVAFRVAALLNYNQISTAVGSESLAAAAHRQEAGFEEEIKFSFGLWTLEEAAAMRKAAIRVQSLFTRTSLEGLDQVLDDQSTLIMLGHYLRQLQSQKAEPGRAEKQEESKKALERLLDLSPHGSFVRSSMLSEDALNPVDSLERALRAVDWKQVSDEPSKVSPADFNRSINPGWRQTINLEEDKHNANSQAGSSGLGLRR